MRLVKFLHQRVDSAASRGNCSRLVSIDEPLHRLREFSGRRQWKIPGFALIEEGYGHVGAIYIFITMLCEETTNTLAIGKLIREYVQCGYRYASASSDQPRHSIK